MSKDLSVWIAEKFFKKAKQKTPKLELTRRIS